VELLVIRHGVAEEREDFAATGKDDSLRPLTKEGRWKMERGARALRRALPSLNVIATSPFTRAAQTAKIVAAAYDDVDVERVDALTPEGRPQAFLAWLRGRESDERVAAVGHEPHLGSLVYWLLTGEAVEGRIAMKKGGACLLELDPRSRARKATLLWALTPSLLRRLDD
jgi:phosphohistidine phosphatase